MQGNHYTNEYSNEVIAATAKTTERKFGRPVQGPMTPAAEGV